MNKKSLANRITPEAALTKKQSEFALSAIFERIRLFVKGDKRFVVPGFGEFYVERRKMQTMVDHNRKALVLLPPKDKIMFRVFKSEETIKASKTLDSNIAELIKEVTEELLGYHEFKRINFDETACYEFFLNLFENLKSSIHKDKNVNIGEFGKFKAKDDAISFSPSKKFAEDINYNFSNLNSQVVRQLSKAEYSKYGIKEDIEKPKEEKQPVKEIIEDKETIKKERKIDKAEEEEARKLKEEFLSKTLEDYSTEELDKKAIHDTTEILPEIKIKAEKEIPSEVIIEEPVKEVFVPPIVVPEIKVPVLPEEPKEPEVITPVHTEKPKDAIVEEPEEATFDIYKPAIEPEITSKIEVASDNYKDENEIIEFTPFDPNIFKPLSGVTTKQPSNEPLTEAETVELPVEEDEEALSIGDIYSKLKKSFSVIEKDDEPEIHEPEVSEPEEELNTEDEITKRKRAFETKLHEHKLDDDSPVKFGQPITNYQEEKIHTEDEIRDEYEEQRKKFEEELKSERQAFENEPDISINSNNIQRKQDNSAFTMSPVTKLPEVDFPPKPIEPELPKKEEKIPSISANTGISDFNSIDSVPIVMDDSPLVVDDKNEGNFANGYPERMEDYFEQSNEPPFSGTSSLSPTEPVTDPIYEEPYVPQDTGILDRIKSKELPQKPPPQKIFGIPVSIIIILLLTLIIIFGGVAILKHLDNRTKVAPQEQVTPQEETKTDETP